MVFDPSQFVQSRDFSFHWAEFLSNLFSSDNIHAQHRLGTCLSMQSLCIGYAFCIATQIHANHYLTFSLGKYYWSFGFGSGVCRSGSCKLTIVIIAQPIEKLSLSSLPQWAVQLLCYLFFRNSALYDRCYWSWWVLQANRSWFSYGGTCSPTSKLHSQWLLGRFLRLQNLYLRLHFWRIAFIFHSVRIVVQLSSISEVL
jgi:hypothetical protein